MKINSKKDVIDFIKRFAVPEVWSIVLDTKTGSTYRVMKKGKFMQIPIQSLNSNHAKKFPFDFDEAIYVYYLEDEYLDDIELVLASGGPFTLSDGNSNTERKRDKKKRDKKEEKLDQKGIDVTG